MSNCGLEAKASRRKAGMGVEDHLLAGENAELGLQVDRNCCSEWPMLCLWQLKLWLWLRPLGLFVLLSRRKERDFPESSAP